MNTLGLGFGLPHLPVGNANGNPGSTLLLTGGTADFLLLDAGGTDVLLLTGA